MMTPERPGLSTQALTPREEKLLQMNLWAPLLLAAVFAIAGAYGVGVAIPALYASYAWRRGMQVSKGLRMRYECLVSSRQVIY